MKNLSVSSSFEQKKVYVQPKATVVLIDNTDIIATSDDPWAGNDDM